MHIEKGSSLGYSQDIVFNVILSCTLCMTTGQFGGILAGQEVTFMVDLGSELNLISEDLHS